MSGFTTIYRLRINEVEPDPKHGIFSSYKAPRHERSVEYFQSRTSAEKRKTEIYEGMKKLVGFIGPIEVVIEEVRLNQ